MDFRSNIDSRDIELVLKNLPKVTKRKAIMPSLRAGGVVIKDRAEANLKSVTSGDSTGVLEKNIRVYNYKKSRRGYRVGVQIRRKAVNTKKIVNGEPVRVGLYGSVLEYRDGGRYSWLRKAAREGNKDAYGQIVQELGKRIAQAVYEAKQ